MLMTVFSALHNLSRSLGCALLAASSNKLILTFLYTGEILFYLTYKVARGDFIYFVPFKEIHWSLILSFVERVLTKTVVDFSGCLHYRHPLEMGGLAFSLSMVWAQVFPFVALQLFEGEEITDDMQENVTAFLFGSFGLWLILNAWFFCTIDLHYINTFFGT